MCKYLSEAEQCQDLHSIDESYELVIPKEQIATSEIAYLRCPYCGAPSGYKDSLFRDAMEVLCIQCSCGKEHIVKRVKMFYLYKVEGYDE